MGIHSDTRHHAITAIALTSILLCSADVASAGSRLYTGSIQIRLHSGPGYSYSIPFGVNFSYPNMNNLPSGDLANTVGSAPVGVGIAPNQMALKTSVRTFSPPVSWYMTFVSSNFSGGNGTGSFSAGGAPGPATSAPVVSVWGSRFGVSFSGTPAQFGGTMRLLADFSARYSGSGGVKLPLGAIGGNFGGKLTAKGYQGASNGYTTYFTESVWGFPWTTGTVTAMAPPNPYFGTNATGASLTAKGSDKRTPQGRGRLQLVTPFVVRKREQGTGELLQASAGVAIVSLRFLPEPSVMLQLAAGLSGLGALYCCQCRKKNEMLVVARSQVASNDRNE